MKKFLAFIAIGSLFSTVEEFLTIVAVRHELHTFIFTTIIVWPVVLTIVYGTSRLLDRCFGSERTREIAHFLVYGAVGLLTEWFLMAPHLAPWRMLQQLSLPLVLGFQLGMGSFWTTVTTAPRFFINPDERHRRTAKRILRLYLPYFMAVYPIVFLIPHPSRGGPTVLLIIVGYGIVNAIMLSTWFAPRPSEPVARTDEAAQGQVLREG
jgi:hypothetical protein